MRWFAAPPFFPTLFISLALIAMPACSGETEESADDVVTDAESSAHVIDARPNAANEYERIHKQLGDAYMDPFVNLEWDETPGAKESAVLHSMQDAIKGIIAASKIEHCDFKVDYSEGGNALMAHLVWTRAFTSLLYWDALRFMAQPSGGAGAVERLATILRLSRHIATDEAIIPKLIAFASIEHVGATISKEHKQLVQADGRKTLLAELERLKSGQLFDVHTCLGVEAASARIDIARGEWLNPMGGESIPIPESERDRLIAAVEKAMRDIEAAWPHPDAQMRILKIIESSDPPWVRLFIAGFDKFYEAVQKIKDRIDASIDLMTR